MKETKKPVTIKEIYDRTHKRKNGEYISEKTKSMIENYVQQSQEKYGDDPSSQPMVDGRLWLDATRGSKKEKVIGFGNSLNKNLVLSSCAFSSFVPSSSRRSTQESNSDCTSCGAFQA
ncbi:putative Transposase, Ptta/En/Spm, plant [Cocos nucifera]|uniref:Putative Transposase, Ptta/En/Spm, plant n=1 Tax=Cocos nucifera TaxID=13894 RepID=A0A8K0IVC0_COCNU|nr:putative Transposase, Ptta/En/Spm, plant [Cocos nucifera]